MCGGSRVNAYSEGNFGIFRLQVAVGKEYTRVSTDDRHEMRSQIRSSRCLGAGKYAGFRARQKMTAHGRFLRVAGASDKISMRKLCCSS